MRFGFLRTPRLSTLAIAGRISSRGRVPCRLRAEHTLRADRGVAEIGEHTVDAEQVKLEILLCRVEPVVGSKKIRFVAEGVGMDEKTSLVGVSDQTRVRQQCPI